MLDDKTTITRRLAHLEATPAVRDLQVCRRGQPIYNPYLADIYSTIIFSSVRAAEWARFEEELLTRLTVCSLCMILLVSVSRTNFEPRYEKTNILLCENKDADQLRDNREADQRLCFRYTDSTIPLLPKSEISNL